MASRRRRFVGLERGLVALCRPADQPGPQRRAPTACTARRSAQQPVWRRRPAARPRAAAPVPGSARCWRSSGRNAVRDAACAEAAVVHCSRWRWLTALRHSARPMAHPASQCLLQQLRQVPQRAATAARSRSRPACAVEVAQRQVVAAGRNPATAPISGPALKAASTKRQRRQPVTAARRPGPAPAAPATPAPPATGAGCRSSSTG
jgi:hypothetical protein